MRKKLDTRFPAARIKQIMQADEDVGKIALAVPVLMSKALELFLQDLCERTYDITVQTGARTVSSLHFTRPAMPLVVGEVEEEVVDEEGVELLGWLNQIILNMILNRNHPCSMLMPHKPTASLLHPLKLIPMQQQLGSLISMLKSRTTKIYPLCKYLTILQLILLFKKITTNYPFQKWME